MQFRGTSQIIKGEKHAPYFFKHKTGNLNQVKMLAAVLICNYARNLIYLRFFLSKSISGRSIWHFLQLKLHFYQWGASSGALGIYGLLLVLEKTKILNFELKHTYWTFTESPELKRTRTFFSVMAFFVTKWLKLFISHRYVFTTTVVKRTATVTSVW